MDKIVLGFIGPVASGKGTACAYVSEKHGAASFRFSTILRDILSRVYLEHSRENLQTISTIMRQNFGDDVMALAIAKDVESADAEIVVVDGVRREPDIKHLRNLPGFKLVSIDADIRTRFERITQRRENSDDASKTFEQFVEDNGREAEVQIADLQKKADFFVDNNGSFEDLHRQLDEIIAKMRA